MLPWVVGPKLDATEGTGPHPGGTSAMTIFGKGRRQLRRSKRMYLVAAPFGLYEAFLSDSRASPDIEARLSPLHCLQEDTGAEQERSVE